MAGARLEQEIQTYEREKAKLLRESEGWYVLIRGSEVIDTFESEQDALKAGYERYGNSPFLVKRIVEREAPANFTSYAIKV